MYLLNATVWNIVIFIFGGILTLFLYFIPSYIAFKRNHNHKFLIFLLNVFLGVTIIGYVVAVLWAMSGNTEKIENTEKDD